jgi:hypothetical protein
MELREDDCPLTLQIPVCYLSPCYAHSVCRLQANAVATAALRAVFSVGFHQSHGACAVKCCTVVSEGEEKAEEVSRVRDEWVCEFCGIECFCWRYGE